MGGAALFDAHVEDHAAAVAADGFKVRLDYAGEGVQLFFYVGFGGREGSPSWKPRVFRTRSCVTLFSP